MIARSVPYYDRTNRRCADRILERAPRSVVDLGCSTGSLLELLAARDPRPAARFAGADISPPMVRRARQRLREDPRVRIEEQDVRTWDLPDADAVVANYTLQFLAPEERPPLLQRIRRSIRLGGIFLLSEKLRHPDREIDALYTRLYHAYKRRRGYSNIEIEQKRAALDGVLRPATLDDHVHALRAAGFSHVEIVHRWVNFATIEALA